MREFTSKERDSESGLDYFGARYFSGAQGRFTSPDWSAKPQPVPYASLTDPQSLNLYAYVRNNPLKNRDLDGHFCIFGFGNSCSHAQAKQAVQGATTGTAALLLNDGIRRARYDRATQSLTGSERSAARETLQAATYPKLSGIGKAVTDVARTSREGQLAAKTEQAEQSATRTSPLFNDVGAVGRGAGAAGLTVGVGFAAYNVVNAPADQRLGTATREFLGLGGSVAGAEASAEIGAIGGPAGSLAGAVVGGIAGSSAGTAVPNIINGTGLSKEEIDAQLAVLQ